MAFIIYGTTFTKAMGLMVVGGVTGGVVELIKYGTFTKAMVLMVVGGATGGVVVFGIRSIVHGVVLDVVTAFVE